jgi:hypothetical protein
MRLYELALMGAPSGDQISAVEACISEVISSYGLSLGTEVGWTAGATTFHPPQKVPAAVAFLGEPNIQDNDIGSLVAQGIPIIPVAREPRTISADLPGVLKPFNCLTFKEDGAQRIATALLECVGLLPRQRRVFVSYRRSEAKEAALQLFNFLSSKIYEVFLDTHGILPAEDFQGVLWHRLCDSDVLIMLDTQTYFESRWTSAEFGRALAKGISILRIGWPGVACAARTVTASSLALGDTEVDSASGRLSEEALLRIAVHLETARGRSHAVRRLNLFSALKRDLECIGGTVTGVGLHNTVLIRLADGREVVTYPTLGVPTSMTLNEAIEHAHGKDAAILFDHIGLQEKWLQHLTWLGSNIPAARWVRSSEAAWCFAGWGTL